VSGLARIGHWATLTVGLCTSVPQQDECKWDAKEDSRRLASRQQMSAMRNRLADLERLLHEKGIDPDAAPSTSFPRVEPASSAVNIPSRQADYRRRRRSFPDEEEENDGTDSDTSEGDKGRQQSSANHIASRERGVWLRDT